MTAKGLPQFVVVSGAPYHGVHRSARGITDALGEGTRVLFVDPPMSVATKRPYLIAEAQITRGEVVQEASIVFRLVPNVPPSKDRVGLRPIAIGMMARQTGRFCCSSQRATAGCTRLVSRWRSIMHPTTSRSARACSASTRWHLPEPKREPHRPLTWSSLYRPLVERSSKIGARIEFSPNAVDASAVATADTQSPATDVTLPHPIAGVAGTLSERLDLDLLNAVADRMSLLVVGPENFRTDRSTFVTLIDREAVQWVGPKPFEALGSYYRHIDVGLVPYTLSTFNQSSFPLKSLECLAAGEQVVSTGLRAIEALQSPGITFASSPAEFAVAALQQARIGASPDSAVPLRIFASQHTWATRATRLMENVRETDHAI